MTDFQIFVFTPSGLRDLHLAVSASRAGAVGVYNAEFEVDGVVVAEALSRLDRQARGAAFGIRLGPVDDPVASALKAAAAGALRWVFVDRAQFTSQSGLLRDLRARGVHVLLEVLNAEPLADSVLAGVDGLVVKGNECGGFVGEDASFILLQKWLKLPRAGLPLFLRGGLTPHVAAACQAVGVGGGVLEAQLLMLDEVRLPTALRGIVSSLSGSETVAVGDGEHGEYFRLLVRPALTAARNLVREADGLGRDQLATAVSGRIDWREPATALLPVGQEAAFAAPWARRHGRLSNVLQAFREALCGHRSKVANAPPVMEAAPLARGLGLRYPIVQGPMTRVSDTAEFALAIAEGGALPMVAFAMLKGQPLQSLLERTAELLGELPWGIGLLGFAPQELLDEQLSIATRFKPAYAIIAGGRPDQAVQLERSGIPTFLHVPAAGLIPGFLQEGARRFIFEGRECGGHIGPLSSFVLWSMMVDKLLDEFDAGSVQPAEVQLLFAGGIHDAVSSAMLQVLVAPLVARGAQIGILMGSAYLFTQEIVASGSIVPQFQQEVLDCAHTVNLESGPGHASRCAYTPFAQDFFRQRREMRDKGVPPDESRRVLDDLILGRLRIASKGSKREGLNAPLQRLEAAQQRAEGMYMLGQVATLRDAVTSVAALHTEVTEGAAALLARDDVLAPAAAARTAAPADVAIVGIGCVLPKTPDVREYWENILARIDAITEIPQTRWDWRLYFDADRQAKDKVYSKWGGFLDDLAFDPTQYGMPPKAIESVDPMQMMGLEVARRTLVDAGYGEREFDRERASVIIGASGGAGDFGLQYGLRAELPRFSGGLPAEVAGRLPEWTEDSFAGILPNVVSGRIANRLNFGGINLAVDAACASSLAAVYQGVTELVAGRSDFVIAGGVDTVQGPFGYLCFSKTQALSPRGRCHTFDAEGDGIVISEGIAMVALKRLADAERDGDRIYGVIKGVGASSDGKAKGLTAPLPAGQLRAMRRAYEMAGFGPSTVGLFEAHGTGTVVGDTAELESTTRLMREEGAGPRQAVIGSVKTNIGHTKASAGVAALVKAALSLHHRVLPPHRNVTRPNAVLADPTAPLYLLTDAQPWLAREDRPRRAACSAFGFGGTNFHVVLEEYADEYREWLQPPASHDWSAELLLWSAADRTDLLARVDTLREKLPAAKAVKLRDLAASLAGRWRRRAETLAIVARHVEDLQAKLAAAAAYLRGEAAALPPGVFHGSIAAPAGKIAFLFSGQGSQYPGMGREAALHFEPVAQALAAADTALAPAFGERFGAGTRLSQFLFPRGAYDDAAQAESRRRLTSTDVAQPALGALEAGLLAWIRSLGLEADMAAGHSYGEFAALHAAGAIDFGALMQLSAARGRFIVDAAAAGGAELGTMAAVNAPRKVVEDAIVDIDGVIIANHNAPLQCIVSGTEAGVKAATERLAREQVEVTPIPVAAAFHSSLVKPAQAPLSAMIDDTPWQALRFPVYSNTTARAHATDVGRVKRQMAEHLVRPVEFVAQIEAMHADGARIFVEIGPKAVLTRLAARILDGKPHAAIALDDGSGLAGHLAGLAQLLCAGVDLDVAPLFARRECRVGDPAEPAGLRPSPVMSRHAWLLNGSVARRAAEPVRQVGVTVEQAAASLAALPTPGLAASPPTAPVAPSAPTQAARRLPISSAQTHALKRGSPMDERRPPSGGMADMSVMTQYFDTMRQFLETQERVMAAYLGDAAPSRPAMPRARPLPVALPRVSEAPAVAVQAPTPVQVAPAVQVPAAPAVAAPVVVPVAAAPAPAPALAPAPQPAAAPAGAALTRDKLVDMLMVIVEEKTGYPRDMVGLDQNLEADLGIDSIKRIEVVGALLQQLPAAQREALTEHRSKLNTQSTLNGMLDLITQTKTGAAAVPFDVAGAASKVDATRVVGLPSRLVMRPVAEATGEDAKRELAIGRFLITRDAQGVAEALAMLLRDRGREVAFVDADDLRDETGLRDKLAVQGEPLGGVLHLAAMDTPAIAGSDSTTQWRDALQFGEKALFILLQSTLPAMCEGAHVVSASALGGLFGREGTASAALVLTSGAVGALKSLREEREDLRVKAIDLDPNRNAEERARDLFDELELVGGRQEVGYPAGQRTVFRTIAEDVRVDPAREAALHDLVVLATGGARGITAEVLRELAAPGNTLVLTGRSPMPADEAPALAALQGADALRAHFVAQVRSGALKLTPGEIQRRVQSVLGEREMRANLEDFRAAGALVEYHAVDVTDADAVGALMADLTQRLGRIDGIVHGAGVIEDKRLADKRSDSWSRVVETKVLGLLALQRHVDASRLKFLSVFSSVAGRYGNSGQSDYATANELMNRLCQSLQARWGDGVAVSALCWGPWGATKFGAGMVTVETEAKFAEKGVHLVSAALGRRLFRQELTRVAGTPVEVVCGEAPWESREAEHGAIARVERPELGPLLGRSMPTSLPTGERIVPVRLDPARHRYLPEHALDGKYVLPAAVALELMAEAAQALWPGWRVVEVREHRLMKGVEVDVSGRDLQVFLSPPPYGSSEGFEVTAALQSALPGGRAMNHYRCVVRLEHGLPAAEPGRRLVHDDKSLSVEKAYGEWLFHGPRFQVIERIEGLSEQGAGADVRITQPTGWLEGVAAGGRGWLFDPGLLDAAAQMAWLWSRAYRDESALPARFGRVVRHRDLLPERLFMHYERVDAGDPTLIRGTVRFLDAAGDAVLVIEELDSIASAALNRLGGTARPATEGSPA
jgi:acyl transferase domain-containing protein/NAD(P)H-dependent flavin oxidoreductase YrpB (nitropropane dioxygenase family)/NADP-dependent 3-hydroxy acid dehydrogenase YdfG